MELQMQLVQAVQVLNHDVLSCNRVAANQWLVQFQQTDAAWEVATSILTTESLLHDFEVELFAAQILKRKIQSDLGTLQPDGRSALQNALLLSARKYSTGPSQLLTQICLALSALILRSPESKKLIEHLFGNLRELQYQGNSSNAVLELLTVLPEEVVEDRTMNANINSDRKWEFTQELLSNSASVLKFLVHLTENEAVDHPQFHDKRHKILRCLISWVRIGCFFEIDQTSVPSHPLIAFAFSSLQVPETFNVSIEVLAELINRHEIMPPVLLPQMISVKDTLLLPALATGNEIITKGLSWLMSELGQAAPGLIAQGTTEALSLADALLRCVTFQSASWEIAESSLPFWCALGECILTANSQDNKKQLALATYLPVYMALLNAFLLRVQVGPSIYSEGDVDRSTGLPDGLARFRVNLEESLTIVCRVLGPTRYVTQLLSRTITSLELPVLWQVLEAQCFLLYATSDVILEGPALDLSSLVNLLLAMHEGRTIESSAGLNLLQRSAAQVVGAFARWICNHPAAVLALLSFLASGLSLPLAASACATALRKICDEVSAISSEPTNLDCLLWIGEGLHKLKLSFKEEEEVICAIGRALSMVTSNAILNDALHRLLKPVYESLEALLVADGENQLKLHSAECAALLDASIRSLHRLGILVSQLPALSLSASIGEEVFVGILSQFWPLLEQLLASRYMANSGLAVATCKSLSEAIQAGGQYFVPLLPKIVKSLGENFLSFQQHVCFIKLAITIIEEFGHEKDYGSLFLEILRMFSAAEAVASLNSSYACDQEPDIAEAYFNFMSTFLRSCPKGVIAAADVYVEASLTKATICCTVMHRGAAFAAMSYISCFLDSGLSSLKVYAMPESSLTSATLKICSQCGESIVSGMLYALLGPSAMSRVYKATTILQQLAAISDACDRCASKFSIGWSSLQCWIISAIQALPTEYLRQGEAEVLSATWLDALRAAASDLCINSAKHDGRAGTAGYLHGDGGRSLKRVLRDFADQHRVTSPICVP